MKKFTMLNVLAGTLTLLFAGIIYGWSVLSAPIAEEFVNVTSRGLSFTFTLTMTFFCLSGLVAGLLSKTLSARLKMIISALLYGVGFFMTSSAGSMSIIYVSYGILSGTATGFAYNAIMTIIPKHFPKKQGLVSGILLMGFGASSLVIGTIYSKCLAAGVCSWREAFRFIGILTAVVVLIGSWFVVEDGQKKGNDDRKDSMNPKEPGTSVSTEKTPKQMLLSASFWLFFLWEILISVVGLSVISQAKPIASMISSSLSLSTIALLAGLISVCNGIGRIIFGAVFDAKGWRVTMLGVTAVALLASGALLLAIFSRSVILLGVSYLLTGITYGGGPTLCAAFTKDFYGEKHYAVNFQIVLLNLLPASFSGTVMGYLYDVSGSYLYTGIVLIICSIIALPMVLAIRK